ncbi:MAG TPA: sigma-70 family RNA polymerase sigma factor [Candidatus Nanoarchaeia archaeon]|nr:sigma-70 family RNA polymerase sigma factor [Candidatus Nanoarchaeia archaeon]
MGYSGKHDEINDIAFAYFSSPPRRRSMDDRNRLLEVMQPVVRGIARFMSVSLPHFIDVDDLIGYGNLGLVGLVDRDGFDTTRGYPFTTYARPCIQGAIKDGLRSEDRVPRHSRDCTAVITSLHAPRLHNDPHAPIPSYEEVKAVAKARGTVNTSLPSRKVYDSACALYEGRSHMFLFTDITAPDKDDGEYKQNSLSDGMFADPNADQVRDVALSDEVRRLCSALAPQERRILELYYFNALSMKEIGHMLKLTESRICQIHKSVMEQLRRRFAATA